MAPVHWQHFWTGPYLVATAPCLSKLFPPARSAQVVRIKLAAHKLAELAGHTEAVLWQERAGRLKLACLLARGRLVCGGRGAGICYQTSSSSVFNRFAVLSGSVEVKNEAHGVNRQAPTLGFLLVIDGLLDLSMQHVVAGLD